VHVLGAALVAAIVTLGAGTGDGAADPLRRVEQVTRALAAVRGLGPAGRDRLDRELYTAARAQCRADTATPAVTCLITAARSACATDPDRARCAAAADVVITNLRASKALVDEPTRIRLARSSTDYRVALAAELRRRYAILAAELVLGGAGPAREAAAIDALCMHRDREIHACEPGDAACVPSLAWSRCVAALVWFVGGGT
jgi:hypothetical protein